MKPPKEAQTRQGRKEEIRAKRGRKRPHPQARRSSCLHLLPKTAK